jgi:uncharacterized protein YhbP (UPF0306 family)
MESINESYEDEAKRIIDTNRYMVLATSGNSGDPWAAVVFYTFDKKYNFYFLSAVDAKHSTNIAENPNIAFVIFDANQLMGYSESVQAECSVSFVKESELETVIKLYADRAFHDSKIKALERYKPENYGKSAEFRFYKAEVKKLYITGTVDRRTEIDLKEL